MPATPLAATTVLHFTQTGKGFMGAVVDGECMDSRGTVMDS